MTLPSSKNSAGRVASLHLHPPLPDGPLGSVECVELVEGLGILGDDRYFGRLSRKTGQPSRRQVSLISREQIAGHAAVLGLESIAPGAVRANMETSGIDLMALVGRQVAVGSAILNFHSPRTPCQKMDVICSGLRARMENERQGVMAEVVRSGRVSVGDPITIVGTAAHLSD